MECPSCSYLNRDGAAFESHNLRRLDRPVDIPDSEIDLLPVAPTIPC